MSLFFPEVSDCGQGSLGVLHADGITEWSPERFASFINVITQRLSTLIVQSADPNDKVGAIFALDELIDCEAIEAAQKASKYSNYLRAALKSNDAAVLDAAAHALGHLARPGGAFTAELVEAEMTSAFEWLQPDSKLHESRRLAAVLLIRELARNERRQLFSYVSLDDKYGWISPMEARNSESVEAGVDEREYDALQEMIKTNNAKRVREA